MTTLNRIHDQITKLNQRHQQIETQRAAALARLEELKPKYSGAIVDDDAKATAHLRTSIQALEIEIAACEAAVPEIERRLAELSADAEKESRLIAAKATVETRSAYLATFGEVDEKTTAVIQEQLAPLYRKLRDARAAAAAAERKEFDLLGKPLPAEPAWLRAAKAGYPDALWRLDTIEGLAETGNPPGAGGPVVPTRVVIGEAARRLGLS